MDFDEAKENIQPLAQGRNASILHASLRVESPQELLAQRKELEKEIRNYSGDDPLSAWYNYIEWIEQSFPSGGKESGLQEVLSKCLSHFENDQRYNQDRRMIKLYIKFIESQNDAAEIYQQLFNGGIGSMVADFYIAWAYCYDLVGNTRRADEVFRRGIACRAQPLEDLQEAHQHFGFTVAQRLMYKDDDSVKEETDRQLKERRLALASLRGNRRKQMVGSIRTGAAVKNVMPGIVKSEAPSTSSQRGGNVRVQVFKDENESPNVFLKPQVESTEVTTSEEGKSVVRSIIDAARNRENQKEPGPWNKAHKRKKGKLFSKTVSTNELGFEIHEDNADEDDDNKPCIPPILIKESEIKFDKPFIFPPNFYARSRPIKGWATPVTTEEQPDANTIPQYNKCKLYPRPNVEFQPEELKAFNIMKKRGIQSDFIKERDIYWGCGPNFNLRLYPHFAKHSKPQKLDAMDQPFIPECVPPYLKVPFNEIYNKKDNVERQFEEILALRIKRNETIRTTADMEETMCISDEKQQRRKSFFPMRKSLAPSAIKATRKVSIMPECVEQNESIIKDISIVREEVSIKKTPICLSTHKSEVKTTSPKLKTAAQTESECLSAVETSEKQQTTKPFQIYNDDSVVETANSLPESLHRKSEYEPSKPIETSGKQQSSKPFQIYNDDSVAEIPNIIPVSSSNKQHQLEDDFQFKTPALPVVFPPNLPSLTKPNKVHFEIFEDESTTSNKRSPNNLPKPDFNCGSGGFFDPEETCSTQTFNIFLKAQSVSTPKAITKSQPQRQFGNLLKEVVPTVLELPEEQQFLSTAVTDNANENSPASATGYSPPRQQLSTILETSEHGTTQGTTHTTGATTKSTFSSPEFELESQVQAITANTQIQGNILETVKESSREASTITSPADNVQELMTSLNIQNKSDKNLSKQYQQHLVTPGATRLQKKSEGGGLNFSIFEDNNENKDKLAGNFSRLEEKEDTAAGSVFKTIPPIRFQDDKTETITKMQLFTSRQEPIKYQDDKTETISKMLMAPLQSVQFPEDKTETISKLLLAPPQTIKFPEDKTETMPKFILNPPPPVTFDDENIEPLQKSSNSNKIHQEPMDQDDSFQFFAQTPPKAAKLFPSSGCYFKEKIRNATDARTPLSMDAKRFCDKNTPDTQKSNINQNAPQQNKIISTTKTSKSVFRDSFIPDFSIIEDSQPPVRQEKLTETKPINNSFLSDLSIIKDSQPQSQPTKPSQIKSVNSSFSPDFSIVKDSQPSQSQPKPKQIIKSTNNSFLPDFSIVKDSQPPQSQPKPKQIIKSINNSFLPDFSIIQDSQPQRQPNQKTKSTNNSFLPDFSHIPETQVDDSVVIQSQPVEPRRLLQQNFLKSSLQSPFSNVDFSRSITENQLKNNSSSHWKQTPNPKSVANQTQEGTNLKNILMDTFMKDFSEINEPPPIPKDVKEMTLVQPSKNNSSLKFLNESLSQKSQTSIKTEAAVLQFSTSSKGTKLNFLEPTPAKSPATENKSLTNNSGGVNKSQDKYFELNCETEMFGMNMSQIKNSTWLPNHCPTAKITTSNTKQLSNIQEDSLHIKQEEISQNTRASTSNLAAQASKLSSNSSKPKTSILEQSNDFSFEISPAEKMQLLSQGKKTSVVIPESPEYEDDDCDMSIYYKKTPKTPKPQVHIWDDADAFKTPGNNRYMHAVQDLNQTHQLIEHICIDPNVNPFNVDLIQAFLEQHYFISYLESLPSCKLVGAIQRLKQNSAFDINGVAFEVVKLIGEGAYGAVFCGKEKSTGKIVAMKQEKPPNYWEYYICLEIQARIQIDEILPAYMSIDHALIGHNSSILISQFSQYGSLISVCNKIKKHTMKNVDEYVVMLMACELLEIMDHLHAVKIIHADIKADNVLLINKLAYPLKERCLQFIDFGVSIDMKLFKEGQTFSFIHNDNSFKCPEMREKRPWTYQLDLYGLAGVLHVLLFGKYMDIEKKPSGVWMHKTNIPRYMNKILWDPIFKSLLNIRDCNSMPNLQDLRALLKEEIEEKEVFVIKKVNEFNRALTICK